MEDLFWKFYCCKWKLTSWCFNVDPQKPLGIIHKGDVEEKMAASPPNPESRQAKSEDRLVGTGKTVFKSFQTDSEWRLKLQSLSPLMRKVKHLGLGFYSLFFFKINTLLLVNTWSVSADVCFDPNFHHFYYSCPVKNMIFLRVLNDWIWLLENSKKQNKLVFRWKKYLSLDWSNAFNFFFLLYCSYFALKNLFLHNFIRTPFWSVVEHEVWTLRWLEKLQNEMSTLRCCISFCSPLRSILGLGNHVVFERK